MKSFLKYQNGDVVSTFYNRKFTKLQGSSNFPNKVCGINILWCITLLYVNKDEKKSLQCILLYSVHLVPSSLTCRDHIL